jgi:hypothetical protein
MILNDLNLSKENRVEDLEGSSIKSQISKLKIEQLTKYFSSILINEFYAL